MGRIHKSIDNIRTVCNDIIDALGMHPPAVRLIVAYAAQIALELNECSVALRELALHNLAQRVTGCAGILRGEVWLPWWE